MSVTQTTAPERPKFSHTLVKLLWPVITERDLEVLPCSWRGWSSFWGRCSCSWPRWGRIRAWMRTGSLCCPHARWCGYTPAGASTRPASFPAFTDIIWIKSIHKHLPFELSAIFAVERMIINPFKADFKYAESSLMNALTFTEVYIQLPVPKCPFEKPLCGWLKCLEFMGHIVSREPWQSSAHLTLGTSS